MKRSFTIPEGTSNQCPNCQSKVQVQPTSIFGEYNCSDCESKLWFLAAGDVPKFFDFVEATPLREYVIQFIAEKLELDYAQLVANPELLNTSETDSLERLEMLMELEEQLEIV